MPNHVSFFAINADDVPRGGSSTPPSSTGRSSRGDRPVSISSRRAAKPRVSGHSGGLQERRELVPGQKMIGLSAR
jgi:hypothetical protein